MKLTTTTQVVKTALTPLSAFQLLRDEASGGKECFLLESVEGNEKTARYSFIGFNPFFTFRSKGRKCEFTDEASGSLVQQESANPYRLLQEQFAQFESRKLEGLPFSGGIVGYFSYDVARLFEKLPDSLPDDLQLPDSHFIAPAEIVAFDHVGKKTRLITYGKRFEESARDTKTILETSSAPKAPAAPKILSVKEDFPEGEFCTAVERAKEYVRAGDVFQAVISRRMQLEFEGDSLAFYAKLREINPSPYLFHLDFGNHQITASSPEMLVKLEGSELTTRPIAGTAPRSADAEEDEKLKVRMLLDEKERAEHLMLVDLHRNDMSKVCESGSVKVNEFMNVEKYSHVQHIVSNVAGKLRPDKNAFDALEACFPAGTVTGAPKVRAMEVIEELEKHKRGPYGGVAGYFDFSGNMDFAITIRSVVVSGNKALLQAGAGIVYDSVPKKEFAETRNKMRAMVEALGGAST